MNKITNSVGCFWKNMIYFARNSYSSSFLEE